MLFAIFGCHCVFIPFILCLLLLLRCDCCPGKVFHLLLTPWFAFCVQCSFLTCGIYLAYFTLECNLYSRLLLLLSFVFLRALLMKDLCRLPLAMNSLKLRSVRFFWLWIDRLLLSTSIHLLLACCILKSTLGKSSQKTDFCTPFSSITQIACFIVFFIVWLPCFNALFLLLCSLTSLFRSYGSLFSSLLFSFCSSCFAFFN